MKNDYKIFREIFKSLTPREQKVLELRAGIRIVDQFTIEETMREFDIPRDRVKQIEKKAKEKFAKNFLKFI